MVMRKQVKTVRLDDIMQPGGFDVDYLKVDVQGAEMMVLQGSEKCLENVLVLDVEVSIYFVVCNLLFLIYFMISSIISLFSHS